MTINKIIDIINKPDWEYNHETPDKLKSKEFAKAYKKYVAEQVKPYGLKVVAFSEGWCECSGFVTNEEENKFVYFNSGDYRIKAAYSDPINRVLIRPAQDTKDYKGGFNQYTDLKNIGENINKIINDQHLGWGMSM